MDITNYLALVWGQPAHAFDLDKLNGGICVRFAKAGEKIQLLDNIARTLAADDLLIADHQQPAALGGIMGGAESGVSATTCNVLIEAASFAPEAVRGKTRRYQLSSEGRLLCHCSGFAAPHIKPPNCCGCCGKLSSPPLLPVSFL